MTDREKEPERPSERIESPGTTEEKTRPFRTMESVDPDATVPLTTRTHLKSPESRLEGGYEGVELDEEEEDEEDEEPGELQEDEDEGER